jgi:hypothetical protein
LSFLGTDIDIEKYMEINQDTGPVHRGIILAKVLRGRSLQVQGSGDALQTGHPAAMRLRSAKA